MGEHNCCKTDVTECIKKKAYDFWVEKCRKQGRDVNYWLDAEKISDDVAVRKFDGAHSD